MQSLEYLVDAAWQAISARDNAMAMELAKQAHQQSPQSPAVQHVLGLLASRDNQHQIALQLLQESINNGGKTARKLRDMAEALFAAGYAEQALSPLDEAAQITNNDCHIFGLRSAIMLDLEDWHAAADAANLAHQFDTNSLAWSINAAFASLMLRDYESGFKYLTARDTNFKNGSRSPAFFVSKPSEVFLKTEQGLGDTLFYLRYIKPLKALGWRFHIEAEQKLVPLLQGTGLFETVNVNHSNSNKEFYLNIADLALAAYQCGVLTIPEPLLLKPDPVLVEKYRKQLSSYGAPPYIGVTWRAGPLNQNSSQGVRLLDKSLDAKILGQVLHGLDATVINLQRMPDLDEQSAFYGALGRPAADLTDLNDSLPDMLAVLSLIDEYVAVSNTNVHLREGLGLSSHVFVNRPFQDWRWGSEGAYSEWYPKSFVYRQDKEQGWLEQLQNLKEQLATRQSKAGENVLVNKNKTMAQQPVSNSKVKNKALIKSGWEVVSQDIPKAISYAQQVLESSPEEPEALHLLGWAAVQDLKFELGLSVLSRAMQLAPDNGNICRDYIRTHVLIEQPEQAIQLAKQCLENPNLWAKGVVYYALATAYLRLGDDALALQHFKECLKLIPTHLDALSAAGMVMLRMGEGYARDGFKACSARVEARSDVDRPIWLCPILKGDVSGLEVLILRNMGLGDELSYLRYLPYLVNAGVRVTYWCGTKLLPLLSRLNLEVTLVPDTEPMPKAESFDLAFIVHELPMAAEHLDAPEIADPLPLRSNPTKLEKWKSWLKAQGDGPYIGVNWRAGVGAVINSKTAYSKLAKAVDPHALGEALSGINATWISLQRNVTKDELNRFSESLGSQVSDAAGITDDLDDLLCLLSLLDENVGVSNTNMHLRAGLNKGSQVLVSFPSNDWRWGGQGKESDWFKLSQVYRQDKDKSWSAAMTELRASLLNSYGETTRKEENIKSLDQPGTITKKLIWVTGGDIKQNESGYYSSLKSAQERVINVAQLLESDGWHSDYLVESVSEMMGGWQDKLPNTGDFVIFSKVFTEHAIVLMNDARARGAKVIVDVFNDFAGQPTRDQHQRRLIDNADFIVSSPQLRDKWSSLNQSIDFFFADVNADMSLAEKQSIQKGWHQLLLNGKSAENYSTSPSVDVNAHRNANFPVDNLRVLVGMMYAGESEYALAKEALAEQTHQNYQLIEVKDLPNKEAHDTLYTAFMQNASSYDYFLKLDADMVFAHKDVLRDMLIVTQKYQLAHLFAWVEDCPSGQMIPGIQMFKSDTQWLGSDEQLVVDYPPKVNGASQVFFNKTWIKHMPEPDDYQLFRYGVHKALKSLQPDRDSKNASKGILHLTILNGIARNVQTNPSLWFTLIGAALVYDKVFDTIEYNGDKTRSVFEALKSKPEKFEAMRKKAEEFWSSEVRVNFWWIEHFPTFKFNG